MFFFFANFYFFRVKNKKINKVPKSTASKTNKKIYLSKFRNFTFFGKVTLILKFHFLNNLFSVLMLCADSNFSETAANIFVFIMLGVLVLQGIAGGVIFFNMRYRPRFAKGVKTLNNGEKANALFGNPVMIAALVAMVLVALTSISF